MPIFLAFTILFAIYLNYKIRKASKNEGEKDNFLELEAKANFSRRKDISTLNYISLPINNLPFLTIGEFPSYPDSMNEEQRTELLHYEKSILSLQDKRILNLTGITNTELKLNYGVANLPFLMQYDENFSKLSRSLAKWGKLLYEAGLFSEAKTVLEFAVSSRCDIEDIFLVLGKIYQEEHDKPSLVNLKKQVDCFDERRRELLLHKLNLL